jgi:hypothetical protein
MKRPDFGNFDFNFKIKVPEHKWKTVAKKYLGKDSQVHEMQCITDSLCKPLLGHQDIDETWVQIYANCSKINARLKEAGGFVFNKHYLIPDEFSTKNVKVEPAENYVSKKTVFVSGFLIPKSKLSGVSSGFFINGNKLGNLDGIADNNRNSIVSNFGYFFTPRLVNRPDYGYNTLRPEQEHLSEQLSPFLGGFVCFKDRKRLEFPPLFGRGGIGYANNRVIITTSWEIEKCFVFLGNAEVEFSKDAINTKDSGLEAKLYTPQYTTPESLDEEAKLLNNPSYDGWKRFSQTIGRDMVNLVIYNRGNGNVPVPEIAYARFGEIVMPSCGVVVSLNKEKFKQVFPEIELANGDYIDKSLLDNIKINFSINPPKGISDDDWKNLEFFYSGAHPLIAEGQDYTKDYKSLMQNMYKNMQLHPHSLQTQETFIPNSFRREPRCVLVETKDDKIGTFVFSGRYEDSIGVNYFELAAILRDVHKDNLKNVFMLDSGSAVKLGYVGEDGETVPLMMPAIGDRNYIGNIKGNVYSLLFYSL